MCLKKLIILIECVVGVCFYCISHINHRVFQLYAESKSSRKPLFIVRSKELGSVIRGNTADLKIPQTLVNRQQPSIYKMHWTVSRDEFRRKHQLYFL